MLDDGEELVGDKDADGKPILRAVRPGDITLLFRALSDVSYYEEALREYGIEYYLVGGHAFYAQQEIFDIVNLLRVLANPCDEVALAGVLRSPMFSVLDETLYRLSKHAAGFPADSGACWEVAGTLRVPSALMLFLRFIAAIRQHQVMADGTRSVPATLAMSRPTSLPAFDSPRKRWPSCEPKRTACRSPG